MAKDTFCEVCGNDFMTKEVEISRGIIRVCSSCAEDIATAYGYEKSVKPVVKVINTPTAIAIDDLCGDPVCFDEERNEAYTKDYPIEWMADYLETLWNDEGKGEAGAIDWTVVATEVLKQDSRHESIMEEINKKRIEKYLNR